MLNAAVRRTSRPFPALAGIVVTVWSCVVAAPLSAEPEPRPCPDARFRVAASTDTIRAATCDAISGAVESWASCDVVAAAAITVRVVTAPTHPQFGECLGYFDARTQCLELAAPASYANLLSEQDARRMLPPDTVFRGIVAHEFAHAVVARSAWDRAVRPADHEFIAAVFEMEAYGAEARAELIAADPVRPSGSRALVNLGIYALAPRVFANNAWQIFRSDQDGCALIRGILRGEASLALR